MNLYLKVLIGLLAVSFYGWLYEVYLYDVTYLKFLPHTPYPTYDINGIRVSNDNSFKLDNLLSYVPWYGKIMYCIQLPLQLFNLLAYCTLIIFALVVNIKDKLYLKWKFLLLQLFILASIHLLIKHTPIMD